MNRPPRSPRDGEWGRETAEVRELLLKGWSMPDHVFGGGRT